MNTYKWSAINNAFLPVTLIESYKNSEWDISDIVDIADEIADEFMSDWPEGKVRVVGSDGLPAWADAPPPTYDQYISAAEAIKQMIIDQANEYINSQQWSSKLALGRISDNEKAEFNLWLDYLDAVNGVDTSTATDIQWPTQPATQDSVVGL